MPMCDGLPTHKGDRRLVSAAEPQAQAIARSISQILLDAQVAFGRPDGRVAQAELDLLEPSLPLWNATRRSASCPRRDGIQLPLARRHVAARLRACSPALTSRSRIRCRPTTSRGRRAHLRGGIKVRATRCKVAVWSAPAAPHVVHTPSSPARRIRLGAKPKRAGAPPVLRAV